MAQVHKLKGGCVDVEFLVLGFIANNVYIVDDGEGVIVVDPSCQVETILRAVGDRTVDAIFCTHNHSDHIGALYDLRKLTGAPVYASVKDAPGIEQFKNEPGSPFTAKPCEVDRKLRDGDMVTVGKTTWRVMGTPGHTPGGICFVVDPENGTKPDGKPVCLSGDTLFAGSIGRTDFAGGNFGEMRRSLHYLATLPDDTIVLPGHNSLTTIRAERNRVFRYYA